MSEEKPFEADAASEAIALEERPTGDFIDGYLAGLASVAAAIAGEQAPRVFFSFDWIGETDAPRGTALAEAFQVAEEALALDAELLREWRSALESTAESWLARALAPGPAAAAAAELVELMEAFLGDAALSAYRLRMDAADGDPELLARLGAERDHLLFETHEGRMLLEFSIDG